MYTDRGWGQSQFGAIWFLKRLANVCEGGEPSGSPDFSTSAPAFMSSSTCHMWSLLTQVAPACCFRGLGIVLVPLQILQKPLSLSQTQQLRPRKGAGYLLVSTQPQVPHLFSDLISSPLRCLQQQPKKFLGHSHLVCVLEAAGVFSLSWGK